MKHKEHLIQVKVSDVELSMLDRVCRFYNKTRSQMVRDLILVEHVAWQESFLDYETYEEWNKSRESINK